MYLCSNSGRTKAATCVVAYICLYKKSPDWEDPQAVASGIDGDVNMDLLNHFLESNESV